VGFRQVRFDLDCPAVFDDGFFEPALVPQCIAQIVQGLRQVRFGLEGAAARGDGFFEPACRAKDFAEIGMGHRIIRIERDGLANPFHCQVMAPGLVGDETEKVQRSGMVWLHLQDLAVERLGIRQPPCPVVLGRDLERLWYRHREVTLKYLARAQGNGVPATLR